MAKIPVIDADGHIMERTDEIKKYLDSKYASRPTSLWPGGQPWDTELSGKLELPYGYSRELVAKEQVAIWNRICEEHEIARVILFPTGSGNMAKLQEPEFCAAVCRAANRHFAEDYLTDRLHPMGVLPMRDPEAAARELEYAAGLGLKGFEVLTDGLPFGLGDSFYDPVYEAAVRHDVTIGIHGTRHWSHEWGGNKLRSFAEVHAYAFTAGMLCNFTSVICQGLPNRFPNLRMAFLEVGATWLPYYLDRLDEHYEKRSEEVPNLTEKPSDTFKASKLKVSIEGKESLLRATIDYVGIEHLIYATDVPHWDGEFPENLEEIRNTNELNDAEKTAILHDNAAQLFGLAA